MRVASLRERLLATLVDAAVVILGMAVVFGLAVGAALAYSRVRGKDEADQDEDEDEEEDEEDMPLLSSHGDGDDSDVQHDSPLGIQHGIGEWRQSPLLRAALWGAGAGLHIANRNWRSPGFRVVGLRRVDKRTRGPISVRSALIAELFGHAQQAATRSLFRSRVRRGRDRIAEVAPKLKEIERKYGADLQGRERAVMEFYEANEINPLAGCGWLVAGPVLSQLGLAIANRNGRTAYDLITGTVVVTDR